MKLKQEPVCSTAAGWWQLRTVREHPELPLPPRHPTPIPVSPPRQTWRLQQSRAPLLRLLYKG